MYAGSNPVLTSQQNNCFVSAIGAAVARFPDTEEVTGSIPVSRTDEALILRNQGFSFGFLGLRRDGAPQLTCVCSGGGAPYISSAPSQGTRPRFASGTLRALPENTLAPLRVPDVTTEGTISPPRR